MGSINITVPGNINLEYKIENSKVVEKIIRLIKSTTEKKKTKKIPETSEIVGIWKDRFPAELPSHIVQKEIRENTWKRF